MASNPFEMEETRESFKKSSFTTTMVVLLWEMYPNSLTEGSRTYIHSSEEKRKKLPACKELLSH
jgi:hypothetical protein